jgi:hypothetical protein
MAAKRRNGLGPRNADCAKSTSRTLRLIPVRQLAADEVSSIVELMKSRYEGVETKLKAYGRTAHD